MFLPTNREEALQRGWDELDVVFVTGDAYIDHPAFGVPLLARWLEAHGFRVGIIAQPDWKNPEAFKELGRPRLFFAVAAGAMDSMIAHYTPEKRIRRDDAYTPGNRHGARPNRATIVYVSCCKAAYGDVPVVIGGIEASLRRFAHYDYWDDRVRRSILLDSKADLLVFGMGEQPLLELAERVRAGEFFSSVTDIRGTAFVSHKVPADALLLPSCEDVQVDKKGYSKAFRIYSEMQNPFTPQTVAQAHAGRAVVCNPPSLPLSVASLDAVYALPFSRLPHFSYAEPIPAWEQIKSSVTTHRGCYGGCSFCAITMHQGRIIQRRSIASITSEVETMAKAGWFKGVVSDLGGPTANMFGTGCGSADNGAACRRPSCLFPSICSRLEIDDSLAAGLLSSVREMKCVRHVTVTSGIRFDLLLQQPEYFSQLVQYHVGGLLKVAPEHCSEKILKQMRKPGAEVFEEFLYRFRELCSRLGKRYGVVPYLMSGHPGTTVADMKELSGFIKKNRLRVEQVQQFTPSPGSLATCIYYTGTDPFNVGDVYVARSDREKRLQKELIMTDMPGGVKKTMPGFKVCDKRNGAVRNIWESSVRQDSPVKENAGCESAGKRKNNKGLKKIRK